MVSNVEIRSLDHSANIFIALACLITCGISGIKEKLTLCDPYQLTSTDEKMIKIPITISERKTALMECNNGKPLKDFLGDMALNQLIQMYEEEHKYFIEKTLEQEVKELADKY